MDNTGKLVVLVLVGVVAYLLLFRKGFGFGAPSPTAGSVTRAPSGGGMQTTQDTTTVALLAGIQGAMNVANNYIDQTSPSTDGA